MHLQVLTCSGVVEGQPMIRLLCISILANSLKASCEFIIMSAVD